MASNTVILPRARRWRFLGFVTPLVVLAASSGPTRAGPTPADAAVIVTMTNQLTFAPRQVTISVGQSVEWRNASLLVHTVTADPDKATLPESAALPDGALPFDSGALEPDGTFAHTFTVPGTYRYFCIPHEGAAMVGSVVVEPSTGESP